MILPVISCLKISRSLPAGSFIAELKYMTLPRECS